MSKGKQANTGVVFKLNPKNKRWADVYIKDVPLYYAAVHRAVKMAKGDGKEFKVTTFLLEEQVEALREMPINSAKLFPEVGVDKITKGKNRGKIKYPLDKFGDVEGLYGSDFKRSEYNRDNKKQSIVVVDSKGKPITENIGNGSRGTIKCFAALNEDMEWNLYLSLVMVTDLIPYENSGISDNELGITYDLHQQTQGESSDEFSNDVDEDDVPFDTEEDDDNY